jgi:RNA polymerase sigma-70 factor (ECF subfamily)
MYSTMLLAFSVGVDRRVPPLAPAVPDVSSVADQIAALAPFVRVVAAAILAVGRDHPDVDDATSETLRRAVECSGRIRDGEPVRPWLVGIARHVALDARRVRSRTIRWIEREPADAQESAIDRVATTRVDPFEQLAQARRDARVRKALETLAEGPRRALTLYHLDGLPYDEIGARLGVPMGTVATWISRGRKELAGKLSEEGGVA